MMYVLCSSCLMDFTKFRRGFFHIYWFLIGCRNASVHERLRASVRGSFRRLLGVRANWGQQGEGSAFLMSQCYGSGMFISDPIFFVPDPGSVKPRIRICNKEFKYRYFDPENWKYAPGCLCLIRFLSIPDPGVKMHQIPNPDPRHCSLVVVPT